METAEILNSQSALGPSTSLLFLHCPMEVIEHLGHHGSEFLHHTLAKVIEGVQHLLQAHALQEARVSSRVVGVGGALLRRNVADVQEGFPEHSVQPAAHPGHQSDAVVHHHVHLGDQAVEGVLHVVHLRLCGFGALVDQDVPGLQARFTGAKATGNPVEESLHLQYDRNFSNKDPNDT